MLKTSSKYVMTFLLRLSGGKIFFINAENAAGAMEIPWKCLLNSFCWFPLTNCVKRPDCSSSGIWLYALFMSAVVKYFPFIFVRITWIGFKGQLYLGSSMSELRYLAPKSVFNDSPLAKIIMAFMNVFPFGCSFLFTGEIISYCSSLSSYLLTLSCKWIGTLLACCFLKNESGFRDRCSGEFTFPSSNLDVP